MQKENMMLESRQQLYRTTISGFENMILIPYFIMKQIFHTQKQTISFEQRKVMWIDVFIKITQ